MERTKDKPEALMTPRAGRQRTPGSGSLSTLSIADSPPPVNPQLSGAALCAQLSTLRRLFNAAVLRDDPEAAAEHQRDYYRVEALRKTEIHRQATARGSA